MRRRKPSFLLPVLTIMLLIASCSGLKSSLPSAPTPNVAGSAGPTATASLDGATLVQERCSVCHPASFVSLRTHTTTQWKTIVNAMVQRGAQLTPDEEAMVVEYLAKNYGQ